MTALIDEIYRTETVRTVDGTAVPLNAQIDRDEGAFLLEFIGARDDIRRTLEVGCAYGLSALHILSVTDARPGAHHRIVDPFQSTDYQGIGILNLQRAGFTGFELIEQPSEFALPALAREAAGSLDMVFVDGWHTFDHTLVDLFYANRLVREGGYIVVDDCGMPGVAKAVSYLSTYPAYRVVGGSRAQPRRRLANTAARLLPGAALPHALYDKGYMRMAYPGMVALQKVAPDTRPWNWFHSF